MKKIYCDLKPRITMTATMSSTSSQNALSHNSDPERKIRKRKTTFSYTPPLRNYQCIVLDLDGALVVTHEREKPNTIEITFEDMYRRTTTMWISKRPGLDELLAECFEKAIVGVWSMGQPRYVDAVVQAVFPRSPHFVYNWCHCDRTPGRIFKNLDSLPNHGSTVMVDDRSDVLELSPRVETIIIGTWSPRQTRDKTLFHLANVLFR